MQASQNFQRLDQLAIATKKTPNPNLKTILPVTLITLYQNIHKHFQ